MDAYLLDWANLLLHWAHVITAIAWVLNPAGCWSRAYRRRGLL